ncbi:hypothetical protein [Oceanobacillus sp. FSL W7-1309]|uniref:hypothetical protein n=1 Tax=Oceanobacillus sp. FSL W7-1309 TaxID=2954539 RepID=UPI0030F79FD9
MLKNHYQEEDWPEMIEQVEKLLNVGLKAVEMAEKAEFSTKNELLADLSRSLEILITLNRKKINQDVDEKATTLIRDWY